MDRVRCTEISSSVITLTVSDRAARLDVGPLEGRPARVQPITVDLSAGLQRTRERVENRSERCHVVHSITATKNGPAVMKWTKCDACARYESKLISRSKRVR